MSDIRAIFAGASGRFGELVHEVGDNQWNDATPCTEWNVRALVNHLVSENSWMPPLLGGGTIDEVGDRLDGDLLGEDPVAAWNRSAAAAIEAVREPGAMERTVHLSFGDASGSEYTEQVFTDLAIHAWDLARAIGGNEAIDPAVVELLYVRLAPQEREMKSSGMFGAMVAAPSGASTQTKLLALFGRVA